MTPSDSTLRRLRFTPIRDALRLRLTGRLDIEALLARSGLPAPAADCIRRVVKCTRLWRLEKSDVTQELIAHFQDGLDSGETAESLLASFGDETQAAKLIRRAKKRNRPWVWHAAKRGLQALEVLMLVYVAMWAVLYTRHPSPSVDYLAKTNAQAAAVPTDDRAWPIYRSAWIDSGLRGINYLKDVEVETIDGGSRLPLPGEAGMDRVETFLKQHAALLEAGRRGSAKPGLGFIAGFDWSLDAEDRHLTDLGDTPPPPRPSTPAEALESESIMGVLLPHLTVLRGIGRLLAMDMSLAATQHDGARLVEDYQALLSIAKQSREQPILVNQLVAISVLAMANTTMLEVLDRDPTALSDDQFRSLAHESARAAAIINIDFTDERYLMLDMIQRVYSDDGQGDGTITNDGLRAFNHLGAAIQSQPRTEQEWSSINSLILPCAYVAMASRREMVEMTNHMYDLVERDAARPLWQILHQGREVDNILLAWRASLRARVKYALLFTVMPALNSCAKTAEVSRMVNETVQVVLALELHHRHEGRYPQTLAELSPTYMPTIPLDRSTGEPLRYRLVEGKPLSYGLGKDGVDDGGVTPHDAKDWPWPHVPDTGDWVLYPVPLSPPKDSGR